MRKTGISASLSLALTLGLATFALAAGARPVAHSSACKFGKEAAGCKLSSTAYYDAKSRVIVGFPSATATELTVPAAFVCAGGGEVSLVVKTKAAARIGGTVSFSGKAKVVSFGGVVPVKSASITAKVKIANAKKASLSGKAALVLSDGSKCNKSLPAKLLRVLGG